MTPAPARAGWPAWPARPSWPRLLWLQTALLLALWPPLAQAQTDAATAELLMHRSGLWVQLAEVAPQVRAGLLQGLAQSASQGGLATTASETERLVKVFDAAYAPDRLRQVAAETLQLSTRPDAVAEVLAWYDDPLGRRITRLEEAASADQAQPDALMQRGQGLLQAMPVARRALLERLVALSQSTQAAVQITTDTSLAAQRGLRSVAPDAPGPSEAELRAALQARQPQLHALFSALMMASFASTYQGLSDAELGRYQAFMASAAGQHFMAVSVSALSAALVAASTELGRSLTGIKDQANI